jgi:biofilm PGA synthesis N-glycosyltransferase PgaC
MTPLSFLGIGIVFLLIAVFPYVFYLNGILFGKKPSLVPPLEVYPPISVVISAYNEQRNVSSRIANLADCNYPDVEVVVVDDCSTDNTAILASEALLIGNFASAHLIQNGKQMGTSASYNRAIAATNRDIVVVTDADVMFKKDALHKIVTRLTSEDNIGAVTGDLQPDESVHKVAELEKAYRSFYGRMCAWESAEDSTFNFNGALMAFKKSAVGIIDHRSGADDANIAFNAIRRDYRAVYEQEAVVYEEIPTSARVQFRQKVRRASGLIASVFANKDLMRNGRLFGERFFPVRAEMLIVSPTAFFVGMFTTLYAGMQVNAVIFGIFCIAVVIALMFSNLFKAFVVNQIYLTLGLLKSGRNATVWESTSSIKDVK